MRIPKNPLERTDFALDLINKCMTSQADRASNGDLYRKYYAYGSEYGVADYNKIEAHIEKVSSYVYEPGAVRFSIEAPTLRPELSDIQDQFLDSMTQEYNRNWHLETHDTALQGANKWALVYGCMVTKALWSPKPSGSGTKLYTFEPQMLGVGREDITDLNEQEVLCHQFRWSADEIWRILSLRHNGLELFGSISFDPISSAAEPASDLSRLQLIISGSQPNIIGNATPDYRTPAAMFQAQVIQDMCLSHELWVWNDEEDDYQVFTFAAPDVCIFDRKNMVLPREGRRLGVHPFSLIRPNPVPGYIWGRSEVFGLIGLQRWHARRIAQIQRLQDLQADPPRSFSGFQGLADEDMTAVNDPGSWVQSDMPTAKVESLAPDMPPDIFQEVASIEAFFSDKSGVPQMFEGKGTPGVRNNEQAALLASLGASRIKDKAINSEEGLADAAGLVWRLFRRHNPEHFFTAKGAEFVADQLTDDAIVRVDNHSQSPVFSGGHQAEAATLFKAGALDAEDMIELSHLPGKERLKQKSRKRAEQKQQMFKMLLQADPKMALAAAKGQMKGP
jgi:hypothetical protein